jgi:4-hydroxyphenylpyruvate dioxygenase
MNVNREAVPQAENILALDGIEFIEYATTRPQALGQVLERMGFRPVARHRSREVVLYRQGAMNLIINANPDDARVSNTVDGEPVLSAIAFRVRDARAAHQRCLELGAWDVSSHAQAMELHIPAIHGPGQSRFYFVDRYEQFSIYDIDFDLIPTVDAAPAALANMNYFGIVQYIGGERTDDWNLFYQEFFGFAKIPDKQRFGILPKGSLLKSPCGKFLWQLIEPDPSVEMDTNTVERLQRVAFGMPDVPAAVAALKTRGVDFVESTKLHSEERGALTRTVLGSLAFELVHQESTRTTS